MEFPRFFSHVSFILDNRSWNSIGKSKAESALQFYHFSMFLALWLYLTSGVSSSDIGVVAVYTVYGKRLLLVFVQENGSFGTKT